MKEEKKPWEEPQETKPCDFHPDVQMVWRQKRLGGPKSKLWWIQCCDECEWSPPDIPSFSDNGRTSPEIKTYLDKLGE